jgi:hypothetical protein
MQFAHNGYNKGSTPLGLIFKIFFFSVITKLKEKINKAK